MLLKRKLRLRLPNDILPYILPSIFHFSFVFCLFVLFPRHILKMLLPQFQSEDLSELFDKEITGLSNESNTFNNLSESRSSLNHVFYSNDSTQASQTSSSDNQLTPTERKPCAVLCSFLLVGNYTSHWAFHLQKLANISSDEAKVENMTLDSEQPTASPIPSSCLIGQDAQKAFLTRQLYYPSWYGRQYSSQQVALLGHALEKTYSTNQGTHSLSSTKTGQTAMILPFHPNEIMVDEHNIQEQLVHSSPVISQQTQYPSPYSTQAFQTVTNHSNPSSGSSSSSNSNSSLSSYSAHSSADSSTNSSAGNSYSSLVPNNRQYYDAQFSPPETQTEFISTTISKTLHALRSKITISSKNVTAIMMIINAYFDQQYGDYLAKIEQKYKTKETGKNKRPILLPSIRGIVAVNSKQNVWSPNVPLLHGNPDDIFARYLHKHRHPGFMLYRPIETQLVLSELTPPTHLPTSLHIVWSAIPQTQATVASKSQNTTVSDLSVTLPDTDVTRNRTILYSREDNASLELPCISDDLPEPAPSSDVQELSSNPSHDVPVNHEEMTDLPMPNQANDAPLPAKRFVNATLSRVNLKKRRF